MGLANGVGRQSEQEEILQAKGLIDQEEMFNSAVFVVRAPSGAQWPEIEDHHAQDPRRGRR